MPNIVIENDHFLKIVPVILDPGTSTDHRNAVAEFFAHDEPDFLGWCARLRERVPGLFPSRVIFADSEADLRAKLPDADGLVVESFRVDRDLLVGADRLAIVQKFGTITSNIDLAACAERGIVVATLKRHVNVAVAEQAFALLLALAKRICDLDGLVDERSLNAAGYRVRPRRPGYIGYSNFAGIPGLKTLFGSTIGIIGLGEIGREVAQRAAAFGMTILYHQRRRMMEDEQALGATYVPLDQLMARSDYILVQLPLNETTRGIIGRDLLRSIKPGAVLVNVARAELIERTALLGALDSGRIGGFGLDVGYAEPAEPDDPLLRYDRSKVILMPHTGIGARANALADLERLCLNLGEAIASCERRKAPAP